MSFSGVLVESAPSATLGWLLIAVISALIVYNTAVILVDLAKFAKLASKRYFSGYIVARHR